MSKWQGLLEKALANVQQVQGLLAKENLSEAETKRVDALLTEAEGLQADAEKYREAYSDREARLAALSKMFEQEKRPVVKEQSDFQSWDEFLVAVKGGRDPRLTSIESLLSSADRKALAEDSGDTGGYLVPDVPYQQLLEVQAEQAIVRARAFAIPMSSRSVPYPKLKQTSAPSTGESAFFGGIAMSWTEENAEIDEETVNFGQGELVAHQLSGWLPVPNIMLAASPISVGAMVPRLFASAAAWKEDYEFLNGDGVGKPLGVINAGATVWINRATASEFAFADAVGMLASFLATSWGRGVWVINQSVIPQLYAMADEADNHVWLPNAAEKGPGTLFGIPIKFTEKTPALGTQGDVLLCDFGYYLIGDRQMMSVAASPHERFRRNQTTYRLTQFLDGQPWLEDAITLADGATEVSPFVGLTDASG